MTLLPKQSYISKCKETRVPLKCERFRCQEKGLYMERVLGTGCQLIKSNNFTERYKHTHRRPTTEPSSLPLPNQPTSPPPTPHPPHPRREAQLRQVLDSLVVQPGSEPVTYPCLTHLRPGPQVCTPTPAMPRLNSDNDACVQTAAAYRSASGYKGVAV